MKVVEKIKAKNPYTIVFNTIELELLSELKRHMREKTYAKTIKRLIVDRYKDLFIENVSKNRKVNKQINKDLAFYEKMKENF